MADGMIQVPPDSTGKKVDAASMDVGANTVMRQRIVIGDNSASAQFALVTGGALTVTGNINISAMPTVTVNSHAVSLVAGTAVIGTINDISRTVQVAIGTPFILQGISTTVQVEVGTPFTVNNISATVSAVIGGFLDPSGQQRNVVDSANTALRVNVVAGSSGGPSAVDNSTYSTGAANTAPAGFIFFDASAVAATEGRVAAARMTGQRAQHVNLRTDGVAKMEDSANTALRVNVVAGSAGGPSNLDNTTFSTGVTTIAGAGFIFFSASATTVTDGRIAAGRITDARGQHVNLRNNAGTEIGTGTTPLSVKVENTSATASVVLAAGTANFGTLNNISATVTVVNGAGTANMGGVSLVAGTANIGFINNISATVVTGLSYVIEKTTNSQVQVGDSANAAIRVNIVADAFATAVTAVMSGSHGPVMVNCSVSAATTLIATPGTGLSLYITQLMVSNSSVTGPVLGRVGTSASASAIVMMMAANGGGFVMNFDPPWKLSASERAICSVKPGGASAYFNVNFYVAA